MATAIVEKVKTELRIYNPPKNAFEIINKEAGKLNLSPSQFSMILILEALRHRKLLK